MFPILQKPKQENKGGLCASFLFVESIMLLTTLSNHQVVMSWYVITQAAPRTESIEDGPELQSFMIRSVIRPIFLRSGLTFAYFNGIEHL